MSSVTEIEAAIVKLPKPQMDQLALWFETFRQGRNTPPPVEDWLKSARGAAKSDLKTEHVMRMSRGEG